MGILDRPFVFSGETLASAAARAATIPVGVMGDVARRGPSKYPCFATGVRSARSAGEVCRDKEPNVPDDAADTADDADVVETVLVSDNDEKGRFGEVGEMDADSARTCRGILLCLVGLMGDMGEGDPFESGDLLLGSVLVRRIGGVLILFHPLDFPEVLYSDDGRLLRRDDVTEGETGGATACASSGGTGGTGGTGVTDRSGTAGDRGRCTHFDPPDGSRRHGKGGRPRPGEEAETRRSGEDPRELDMA